jgi:hypothetical protein
MRPLAAVATALAAGGVLTLTAPAQSDPPAPTAVKVTKSCGDEAGPEVYPCAWDARHDGVGKGHSYVVGPKGHVWRVPHVYAHRLRGKS